MSNTIKKVLTLMTAAQLLCCNVTPNSMPIHAADPNARIYCPTTDATAQSGTQPFTYGNSPVYIADTKADTQTRKSISVSEAEAPNLRELAIERGLLTDTYAFPNHLFSVAAENEYMMDEFLEDVLTKTTSRTQPLYGNSVYDILNGGMCFGLAASTVLAHNGVISPDELQSSAVSLHDIELTDEVECLLGGYAVIQAYPVMNKYLGVQRSTRSPEERVQELLDVAERCEANGDYFLVALQFPDGAHAVTGMGMVRGGEWTRNDIVYDTCILVNDSNLVDDDGNALGFHEKGCIYVNSETLQFYIPAYDAGTEQEGNYIGFTIDDTQLLSYYAPLHGVEDVDVFAESAGYVQLMFYYGTMPDEVYASQDGGQTYEPILDKLYGIGKTGGIGNASILYVEGNAFYAESQTEKGLDFVVYGDGYSTRGEADRQCEVTLKPDQVIIHNSSEKMQYPISRLDYDDGNFEYSRYMACTSFAGIIYPDETIIYRKLERGIEYVSSRSNIMNFFAISPEFYNYSDDSDTNWFPNDNPHIDSDRVPALVPNFNIAQSKALFTYNEEQEVIEQYIDLDDDGVYETLIERGDVNGDGIAYDVIDAQTMLIYYVEWGLARNFWGYLNRQISDVNNDGELDVIDAQLILQKYVNGLAGLDTT